MGPDDIHVFAQGKNQALECMWWTAETGWHGPKNYGGKIAGAPTAVVREPSVCDVFARAPGDDTLVGIGRAPRKGQHRRCRLASGQLELEAELSAVGGIDERAACRRLRAGEGSSARIDVVGGGIGLAWPKNYGGKIVGAPSVVYRKPGVCDVFARGLKDRLFEISWVTAPRSIGERFRRL